MFFGITDVGKQRDNNEDYFISYKLNENITIHIVADGIGGYKAGEVASKVVVDSIIEYLENKFDNIEILKGTDSYIKKMLKSSVIYANEVIYNKQKGNIHYKGMGTTVVMVFCYKNDIYYLSIGDSRIYYIDKENVGIKRLTEDDTYVNSLLKSNVITAEEAKEHTQKHVLVKAVGVFESIDFDVYKLKEKVGILLMCTDGVTNMIKDEELFKTVIKYNEVKNLEKIANNIVIKANENGGADNITVVLVDLETR